MSALYRESLQYIPQVAPGLIAELADQPELAKQHWAWEFTMEQEALASCCLPMIQDVTGDGLEGIQAGTRELSMVYQALCLTVERAPDGTVVLPSVPVATNMEQHVWNMKRDDEDIPLDDLCRMLEHCQPYLARHFDTYITNNALPAELRTKVIAPAAVMYNVLERQMSIDALTMQLGDIARWPTM